MKIKTNKLKFSISFLNVIIFTLILTPLLFSHPNTGFIETDTRDFVKQTLLENFGDNAKSGLNAG